MFRPFGAALGAVILAGALGGVASAQSAPSAQALNTATVAHDADTTLVGDTATSAAAGTPATQPYTVSPRTREELRALATASAMTSADADLRMWSYGSAVGGHHSTAGISDKTAASADPINRFARGIISRTSSLAMSLTRNAMRFIGTPYVFGGTSPSGFDCSGYTQHVFAMLGIALPRTADAQYYAGHPTTGGIAPGDLVFFQTYLPGPSHVGIYLGGGRFISSSGHGVRISALSDSYWAARYLGAKRVASMN